MSSSGDWLNKERPIHKTENNGERMRKLSRCRSGKISKIQEVKKQSTEQYVLYALLSVVKEKKKKWGNYVSVFVCINIKKHSKGT